MWYKYLLAASETVTGKSINVSFTTKIDNEQYITMIADANIGNHKYLHTFLDKYWYHMLMKFVQNRTVRTTQHFELFDKLQTKQTNKQTKQKQNKHKQTNKQTTEQTNYF